VTHGPAASSAATALHPLRRPHPAAPDKPPLNVAANVATSPLDAAADMVRFGGKPPSA
jgi:hypothetical protein